MKKYVLLTCAFAGLLSGPAIAASSCPAPEPESKMDLTFEDTFDGGRLDASKWTTVAQGGADAINGELEAYVPGGVEMLPGGGLRLQANRQAFWKEQYTSGEILSRGHFEQSYGHFEMEAKMPDGDGVWPAFWLLPSNGAWPPEIDIMEYLYAPFGKMPGNPNTTSGVVQTFHWQNSSGNQQQAFTKSGDYGQGYHTYAVDWRPGSIVFMVDGAVQGCISGSTVPSQPMYMIANLAIGPSGSWVGTPNSQTVFPANMDIKYIRAYQFKDVTAGAPDPIAVMNPSVSNETVVTPGQKLTLSADIVAGDSSLPGPTYVQFVISNYDGSQKLTTLTYNGPAAFNAHSTTHVSMPYTFPAGTAPGIYTFAIMPFWKNWGAMLWFGQNNTPPITVVAAR